MSLLQDCLDEEAAERAAALEDGPYYPDIEVQLTGTDGNVFSILGAVSKALRHNGVSRVETDLFLDEAMSGDYEYALQTCLAWVTVL